MTSSRMAIHTPPALSARRRPIKPLLAQHLAGEPWKRLLEADADPHDVPPNVSAACIVSYISRRRADWSFFSGYELSELVRDLLTEDRRTVPSGQWPFLDALELLLPVIAWADFDELISPYRRLANS